MKTMNLLSGVALVTGIAAVSCSKSDFNPTSSSSVNFKIQATSKIQAVPRDILASGASNVTSSSFLWDTCLMIVSKIELEAEKEHSRESGTLGNTMTVKDGGSGSDHDGNPGSGNSQEGNDHEGNNNDSTNVHFEWRGPKTVDLFNLNSVIGGVTLVPGTFANVTIKIESFKSDAGSSPLFYLTGDYTNSANTVKRINIIINNDFELRINKADTLDFGNDLTSIIKVNLSLLLSDISQAELDNADLTNGKLVISSTSNVTLFDKILKNLHDSGESEFERD